MIRVLGVNIIFRSRKKHDYFDDWLEFEVENIFRLEKQVYVDSAQKITQQAKLIFLLVFAYNLSSCAKLFNTCM